MILCTGSRSSSFGKPPFLTSIPPPSDRLSAARPAAGPSTGSWIAASIINMLSSGFSAHSHHRSKERRANFKRVLFQRQFTDKLHDAIFDDIGFNADP